MGSFSNPYEQQMGQGNCGKKHGLNELDKSWLFRTEGSRIGPEHSTVLVTNGQFNPEHSVPVDYYRNDNSMA
jgi:hypothetical protein